MIQDRKGVLTPAFKEFLSNLKEVSHQTQERRRYRQPDGTWKVVNQ